MKDPALLVYTKDFLEGTQDLSLEEFGAYTRLIFHQHQRGFLPENLKKLARLCGVTLSEFEDIWKEINAKFTLRDTLNGAERGWINERCAIEISKRSENSRKKSILAVFGNWMKYNSSIPLKEITAIKSEFNLYDFIKIKDEKERKKEILNTLETLKTNNAKRYAKRAHIANVDVNVNVDINNKGVHQKILDKFNYVCTQLPKIIKITPSRKNAINARVKEYGVEKIYEVFNIVSETPFLNGTGNKNWKADFDWIMNPNNFIKVLEGKYKRETTKTFETNR